MQFCSLLFLSIFSITSISSGLAQADTNVDCNGFGWDGLSPADSAGLQRALDCAALGDTITLNPAASYIGPFTLRKIDRGSGSITIRTNNTEVFPDTSNVRVNPVSDGTAMSVLRAAPGTGPVLTTDPGAHHYIFIGIAFKTDHWVAPLVQLGSSHQSADELVHHITFDRTHFAGDEATGSKRGLEANAGRGTSPDDPEVIVKNSYFESFKDPRYDAQAIVAWNGYGPFLIENNYLEGSGENVMFGGGDPSISGLVPSNITVTRNHFYKPASWKTSPTKWAVKNLFELKNARNVLVQGNVFENNWVGAQHTTGPQQGFAIVLTPRNQDGKCSWCTVETVIFQHNLVKNSPAGFNLLGSDDNEPSESLKHVEIRNNLLLNINPENNAGDPNNYKQPGRLFQINNNGLNRETVVENLIIENNTFFHARLRERVGEITFSVGSATKGFSFRDNVIRHNSCIAPFNNTCGISGDGNRPGDATLQTYFTSSPTLAVSVTGNEMFDGNDDGLLPYPSLNSFQNAVQFQSSNIDQSTGLPTDDGPVDYDLAANGLTDPRGVAWDDANAVPGSEDDVDLKDMIQGVVQSCSEACGPISYVAYLATSF